MQTVYCLIANKPDSDDYCRGCHMASYAGDLILEKHISRDALIAYLEKVLWKNDHLECNEDGYTTIEIQQGEHQFEDGLDWDASKIAYRWLDPESEEFRQIMAEAQALNEKRAQKEEAAKQKAAEAKRQKDAQEQAERERKEYERLRAKFGEAGPAR